MASVHDFDNDAMFGRELSVYQPQPQPPAGEVGELVAAVQAAYAAYGWVEEKQFIRLFDEVSRLASTIEEKCDCSVDGPMNWQVEIERLRHSTRIADLLERQHPQPIPVTERLPEAGDCDAEDNCWWFDSHADGAWYMDTYQSTYTHWLPANALPLPAAEVE